VSIPPNTTAEVWIPSKEGNPVMENGVAINSVRYLRGYAIAEVGSGNYTFSITK
jgi:hypothetical protein